MAWESERIQVVLYNTEAVTNLLSTFLGEDTLTYFCIFADEVIKEEYDKVNYPNTINYYRNSPIDGGLNYGVVDYNISCRANTKPEAEAIQVQVYEALNRKASNADGFFICTTLPSISPGSTTDNYNAPIQVRIKTR